MKVYYFAFWNMAMFDIDFHALEVEDLGGFNDVEVDDVKGTFTLCDEDYRFDYEKEGHENAFRYLHSEKFNTEFRVFELGSAYYIFAVTPNNLYRKIDKYLTKQITQETQRLVRAESKKSLMFEIFSDKYSFESTHYIVEKDNEKVKPIVAEGKLIE